MGVKNVLQQAGDGTAIPNNMVGARISGSLSDVNLTSGVSANGGTLSIPSAGVFLIFAKARIGAGGTTQTVAEASISVTSATHDSVTRARDTSTQLSWARNITPGVMYYESSGANTLYLVVSSTFTGTASAFAANESLFYAIRIA
jgi:flavin-binding protein dodecin